MRNSKLIKKITLLMGGAVFLLLGACASTKTPPPAGLAVIDVKPDANFRKGIGGISLVSINEGKVKGTRSVINPGLNSIKTKFKWPNGWVQQVDLRFYATPGSVYTTHYDVFPPLPESRTPMADKVFDGAGMAAPMILPSAAIIGAGEWVASSSPTSTYIDLVVFGPNSEGAVRKVRAYPDGRVETKPWSLWAQMKDP